MERVAATRRKAQSWEIQLQRWLQPFTEALGNKTRERWAPAYVRGLVLPGERKSIEPIAKRVAPNDLQQLHHFVSTSPWATAPLEDVLVKKAEALVGGGVLIVDDTSLVKKGDRSVGVAHQYCGQLGKMANCQTMVSLTMARDEVPIAVGLRLFLPKEWTDKRKRCTGVGVPDAVAFQTKWQIALDEIDRVVGAGGTFKVVCADAGYGSSPGFRAGLQERGLTWAVGISWQQHVYPSHTKMVQARDGKPGRPRIHPKVSHVAISAKKVFEQLGDDSFRVVSWRKGTKGTLRCKFAACRIIVADGREVSNGKHLPGQHAWLVCERRASGEQKYYLTNHPADTPLKELAAAIKARWVCEQAHQQLKEELGLDHFEGRSWNGLHHHALFSMIAFCFLQHLRLREKKRPARQARHQSHLSPQSGAE